MKQTYSLLFLTVLVWGAACRADNHALLIGVEKYRDAKRITPLNYAAKDVRQLANTLREVADFPAANIRVLASDEVDEKKMPSGANILFEIEQLIKRVKPGDTVIVVFNGHGVDRQKVGYFLTWETDYRSEVTFRNTAMNISTVRDELSRIRVGTLILVFDICRNDPQSGGKEAPSDNTLTSNFAKSALPMPAEANDGGRGPSLMVALFSCSPSQRSWESPGRQRGFFSFFLEKGLIDGAADAQGIVRLNALIPYLRKSVPSAVQKEMGREQTPYIEIQGWGDLDIVLAKGRPPGTGGVTAVPVKVGNSLEERFNAELQRADELLQQKRYDAALDRYEQAFKLNPRSDHCAHQIGHLYYELKNSERAEKWFQDALAINPKRSLTLYYLGYLYQHAKSDNTTAEQFYRQAIACDSKNVSAVMNLALLIQQTNPVEAEKLHQTALELQPKNASYAHIAALFYEQIKKDPTTAEKLYRLATDLAPTNAVIAYNFADFLYTKKKDDPEAETWYQKAIESDSRNARAKNGLANLLFDVKKDYSGAEKLFRAAITIAPDEGVYYANLASALLQQNRKDEALAEAKKALERKYTTHWVFNALGLKP